MKILWLTPLFPYPPFSGGQTRSFNLIKNLAKRNKITLFSFLRPNRIQGPVKEMEKFCLKVKTFKGRKTWTLRNILLAGFTHLPFTVSHFYGDQAVDQALEEELKKENYDLIHFESFYTSPYLKNVSLVPQVMGTENIEYLIYQRFVKQKKFFPLKMALSYDIWKMKRYEESSWRKSDLNLAVSETDAQEIRKVTRKKCPIIPNGIDIKKFSQAVYSGSRKFKEPTFLFVGDFKYFTNQDALNFLTKDIWPQIKKRIPQAKLWLVGKNPNSLTDKLAKEEGVVIDSQVEDIRQAYQQADLLIAPMRIGSGTNIKVLEAMASGLPVLTTSIGVEGIKTQDGKEVLTVATAAEFVQKASDFLKYKDKRQGLGQAGRKLVEKNYDWSKISQKLEGVYQELINEKKN